MTQSLRFTIAWIFFATAFLALAGWLHFNGFLSESTIQIWSKVILQLDGAPGFRSSDALYPPLPFFISLILHNVVGAQSVPVPTLASILVAGLLAARVYMRMVARADFSPVMATFVLILVLGNPVSLYAITSTPEMAFLFFGLWILTNGLTRLRRTSRAPDMMQVGLGLMTIGLSSSYGLLICLSALPFLIVAAPPRLIIKSASGTVLAVIFPVVCAVGSLLLLSAIFDTPLMATDLEFVRGETLRTTVLLFVISAGLSILSVFAISREQQSVVPLLCMIGTVTCAMLLDLSIGYFNDTLIAASPLILMGCVGVCAWPKRKFRGLVILVAASLSWLCGAYFIAEQDRSDVDKWADAFAGKPSLITDAQLVSRFVSGRKDVLIDGEQSPELIIALDGLEGLVSNGDPDFEVVAAGGRPNQSYIVLRNQTTLPIIKDRLMRRFSNVKSTPPTGYFITYERGEWIILERIDA